MIKLLLEQEETNFYTYNPKEDKLTIMLLKELNHSFEESEIMEEVVQNKRINVCKSK